MVKPTLTSDILTAALQGLELQKGRIDEQIAEIRQMLGSRPAPAAKAAEEVSVEAPGTPRRRRKLSAAARKRIAEAQRKRWAAVRGDSEPVAKAVKAAAPQKQRKMSAAGRKRIAEAAKKRWAEFRKQKAGAAKAAPKKSAAKKAAKKGAKRGRKPAKVAEQPAAAETTEG